jgi:hypothetical protein
MLVTAHQEKLSLKVGRIIWPLYFQLEESSLVSNNVYWFVFVSTGSKKHFSLSLGRL